MSMLQATSPGTKEMAAVIAAVRSTWQAICGEDPVSVPTVDDGGHDREIVGVISLMGDSSFALTWGFYEETAPAVAMKFAGMEVPFDSPDMGEIISELVNVLAGDVVAQLEQRGMRSQMSLPMVVRGAPVDLVTERDAISHDAVFGSSQGPFRVRITLTSSGHRSMRMPGRG